MEKFLLFYKRQWAVYTAVLVFVILSVICIINPFNFLLWFFGINNSKTPAEIISFIGVISGAILVIGTLYANNKRNYVMEKGQLDIRFKDAATLLASDNTSANLSGIYALHQIAIEASKDKSQRRYVKVIHEILCAFIRDNSEILYDEKRKISHIESKKTQIIIQSIIDILFCKNKNIFSSLVADLTECAFTDVDFTNLNVQSVKFHNSHFKSVDFGDSIINNCYVVSCKFTEVTFTDCRLSNVDFRFSKFGETTFANCYFIEIRFTRSKFYDCLFNTSNMTDISFTRAMINSLEMV